MNSNRALLRHVRVLELDGGLPTSYAGRLLADLGAIVTRVEVGPDGDPLRQRGASDPDGTRATPGALFSALNDGKELVSLAGPLSLDTPLMSEMVGNADIMLVGRTTLSDDE